MNLLDAKTEEEAYTTLQKLASWSPYKYSGTWYITKLARGLVAFRSKSYLAKQMRKENVMEYAIANVDG